MRLRLQLLVISLVVLTVFYPSIFAEICQVDDIDVLTGFNGPFSLKELFLPGGSRLYYRPLLGLSMYFDRFVWGMDSGVMHLENILMHLCNALLVFFLSRELLSREERATSWLPLICSLFFALHPVNVESVSWISGRTDPMACIFLLAAAILLLRFGSSHRFRYLPAAIVLVFLGALAKESAIGFLLGGALLVCAPATAGCSPGDRKQQMRVRVGILSVCAMIGLVFLMRSFAFSSHSSHVGTTLSYMKINSGYSGQLVLRSFGFYLKKVFFPFPLNFAITEVDPMYEIYSLPAILFSLAVAWRMTRLSALYLTGIGLIAPAFVIAFSHIAWTPFAERYVYMGTAFIVPATVHYLAGVFRRWDREPLRFVYGRPRRDAAPAEIAVSGRAAARVLLPLLFSVALFGTVDRVLTWRTNVSLAADTASKSSSSKEVRNIYGVALYRRGDKEAAVKEMAAASAGQTFVYVEQIDINYASVLRELGRYDEAAIVLQKVFRRQKENSVAAWEELIVLLSARMMACREESEREDLRSWIIVCCDRIYALHPDGMKLYALGQHAVTLKDGARAVKYFAAAQKELPAGDPYRPLAGRIVSTLQERGV